MLSGSPVRRKSSPGTACNRPSACTCGWASASGTVCTGEQGTPAASKRSIHTARGCAFSSGASCANSSALFASRARLVAKRVSSTQSGRPSTAANLANSRSLPQHTSTGASAVSKAS